MTDDARSSLLSYASGVGQTPLLGETIGANFARTVARFSDRDALVERASGRRWTYAELAADVQALAKGLLAIGIEKGDRVGIWAPNCAEWVLVQYATATIGAILVNINPAYRTSEVSFALNQSGVRLLISATEHKGSDYREMVTAVRPDCAALERVVYIGGDDWGELRYFVTEMIGFTELDRLCIPVPFYHCFGMVMANLGSTSHGACMVIPAPAFDPKATLDAVQEERCTALYGVPTMFIAMQNHADFASYDLSSLRTGIMAGSPCPVEVMKRCVNDMHMAEVSIAYGMTETSPVSTQTHVDDDLDRRTSTTGTALPHVEIKIIDPVTGLVLPRGETGEFCTRGYSVMLGYWNEPAKTAEVIDAARWMHTGDLAVMREDGYVNIVGCSKDMVIRGGENVYPREVEEFLFGHPDITDVQVIGVPDERYGEEVCAWIR